MVGRGKGMMGTPGASGGCGGGWATGWAITEVGGVGDGIAGSAAAVFRATEGAFLGTGAALGRAALTVGFALTFEVVICPFDFERRTELSGAPLPIRRCRSILLIQV
jgi:hypothetical protein